MDEAQALGQQGFHLAQHQFQGSRKVVHWVAMEAGTLSI
jgi:hypothetical protein